MLQALPLSLQLQLSFYFARASLSDLMELCPWPNFCVAV